MADPTVTQLAASTSALASTTVSFTAQAANRVLLLTVACGALKSGDPTGWTLLPNGSQVTNHAHYVWYKVASGSETSVTYTINSAVQSTYQLYSVDSLDTSALIDDSDGTFTATPGTNVYATPPSGSTSGRRFAFATLGAALTGASLTGVTGWTNGYTEVGDTATPGGVGITQNSLASAYLVFDGGAATSTQGTWGGGSPDAATAIIGVFKAIASAALSANAGVDQSIFTGQTASLTATASGGAGGTKTYAWSKVSGPTGSFSVTNAASTVFTPTVQGTYILRVTVSDGTQTVTDDVTVSVFDAGATATVAAVDIETSWTKTPSTGATTVTILSDNDGATFLTSSTAPSAQVLRVTLQSMTAPPAGVGLTVSVVADKLEATSGTLTFKLYEGTTLRSTVASVAVPDGNAANPVTSIVRATFPASDLTAIASGSWATGLKVQVEATAA